MTNCTGTPYYVNPEAPDEGTDIRHDGPCPDHPTPEEWKANMRQELPQHSTFIELSPFGYYYWWCLDDRCTAAPGRYKYEQECYDSAREHEQVANRG